MAVDEYRLNRNDLIYVDALEVESIRKSINDGSEHAFNDLRTLIQLHERLGSSGSNRVVEGIFFEFKNALILQRQVLLECLKVPVLKHDALPPTISEDDVNRSVFIGSIAGTIAACIPNLFSKFEGLNPAEISAVNQEAAAVMAAEYLDLYMNGHELWKFKIVSAFEDSLESFLAERNTRTENAPSSPSSFVTDLIYQVCSEIYRTESFNMHPNLVQTLCKELKNATRKCFSHVIPLINGNESPLQLFLDYDCFLLTFLGSKDDSAEFVSWLQESGLKMKLEANTGLLRDFALRWFSKSFILFQALNIENSASIES